MVTEKHDTWRLRCFTVLSKIAPVAQMLLSLYLRLVVLTAGTLLPFFWIVVILGHRRQRNFERVFFFLCLALIFLFGGSLLELNAELFYAAPPRGLTRFVWSLVCLGLWFLPALLVHLHVEYAQVRKQIASATTRRVWLLGAYLPAVVLAPRLFAAFRVTVFFDFVFPGEALGRAFQLWLVLALLLGAVWQRKFAKVAPDQPQKEFHQSLQWNFCWLAAWIVIAHQTALHFRGPSNLEGAFLGTLLLFFAVRPLISLIRNVQKFNFLQIGRQRNLLYAVFAAFLGLLYLSLIRRVSLWCAPYLPPESTAALLLFLPVAFFEPLQRFVGRMLRRTAQTEMDRAQRMMAPIQEAARLGNVEKLKNFIERWVAEQLQLAEVHLELDAAHLGEPRDGAGQMFLVKNGGQLTALLRAKPYGAMLSGETEAALEFLAEQLPGPIDLCRLIEEKLRLERELAERERLALLGQMAASISHNLKNPLGSIKTILQVQLENPDVPNTVRAETKMVLAEINRLSATLSQLLKFSRPTLLGETAAATSSDAQAVLTEVITVLNHEAEKRDIAIELQPPPQPQSAPAALVVTASKEALHDIFSNLLLNALEASPNGGRIDIAIEAADGFCELTITDDGPGIPADLQQKILQPFFTTKTQGTGLGLTIVTRRLSEISGTLTFQSPTKGGAGTKCTVRLTRM
jgi:signal transduction histidine kinase